MDSMIHLTESGGRRLRRPPGFMRGRKLRRVLALALSCPVEGGSVTLVSLELYDDGSILRYFAVASRSMRERSQAIARDLQRLAREGREEELRAYVEQRLRGMPHHFGDNLGLRLEDDAGTQYASMPRGASESDDRWDASVGFTPRVPAKARQLRLTVLEGTGVFPPIRQRGWSPIGGQRAAGQPVATFTVDL